MKIKTMSAKGGSAYGGKTKTKTKAKTKTHNKIKTRKKIKRYSEHYLGIIVLIFLLLEGTLFGITAVPDWQQGLSLLDMGPGMAQTSQDLQTTLAPVILAVSGINDFYTQATDAAIPLLDLSDSANSVVLVFNGITNFYNQASIQMGQVLDMSQTPAWPGSVSGALIEIKK